MQFRAEAADARPRVPDTGYLVKYESVPLKAAIERLCEATKRSVSVAPRFRRELADFEEEALGEASVRAPWRGLGGERCGATWGGGPRRARAAGGPARQQVRHARRGHARVLAGIGEPEEVAAERVMIVLADRRARVDRLALVPEEPVVLWAFAVRVHH